MKPLLLHVTYHTNPGQREIFLRQVVHEGILSAIRAEEGCQKYDYYLSVQDENELLLIERWDSPAHQEKHMTQPHMAKMLALQAEYVAQTTVAEIEETLR